MTYEIFFQCLLCKALILMGKTEVKSLHGSPEKDLTEALKSHYGGIDCRGMIPHHCFVNTGMTLAEGQPIPQMGAAVFAGLRRVV